MRFAEEPITNEGIDNLVSDQEKRENIQKALDIHMLQNREAHVQPTGTTLFSFTQGDPNAVIGTGHGFGKAIGSQEEEKSQKSIEQQQIEQQQQWTPSSGHQQNAPVRTCPCCVRFLKDTFGMDDKEATQFTSGADGGPVGYNGESTAGEYAGAGTGYAGSAGSSSTTYSGSDNDDESSKYMG